MDVEAHTVTTASGAVIDYDKLLVATGPRLAFEKIAGLGPAGRLHAVGLQPRACRARALRRGSRFLKNPGPVVVGTAQGGSCFGASYEFLFNIHHRIRKAGLPDVAPVTFISAEPYLGHFGLGGVGDSSRRIVGVPGSPRHRGLANSSDRGGPRRRDRAAGRTRPSVRLRDDRPAVHRASTRSATATDCPTRWASSRSTIASATPSTPTSTPPGWRRRSRRPRLRRCRPGSPRRGR